MGAVQGQAGRQVGRRLRCYLEKNWIVVVNVLLLTIVRLSRAHEDYGYCQAGTSGILLDDDTALIGTPGVYTWRGTVFVMSFFENYLRRDKTQYHGPHLEHTSPVDKYSYLGKNRNCG